MLFLRITGPDDAIQEARSRLSAQLADTAAALELLPQLHPSFSTPHDLMVGIQRRQAGTWAAPLLRPFPAG